MTSPAGLQPAGLTPPMIESGITCRCRIPKSPDDVRDDQTDEADDP
jgi:hypothetical protein